MHSSSKHAVCVSKVSLFFFYYSYALVRGKHLSPSFHQLILRWVFTPRDVTHTGAWPCLTARWWLPSHICVCGILHLGMWLRSDEAVSLFSAWILQYLHTSTLNFNVPGSVLVWVSVYQCSISAAAQFDWKYLHYVVSLCSFQDISSSSMMLIIKKLFSLSNVWKCRSAKFCVDRLGDLSPKTEDKEEETLTVGWQIIIYFKEVNWSCDNKHFKSYK